MSAAEHGETTCYKITEWNNGVVRHNFGWQCKRCTCKHIRPKQAQRCVTCSGFCDVCCCSTEEGNSKNIILRSQFGDEISAQHKWEDMIEPKRRKEVDS